MYYNPTQDQDSYYDPTNNAASNISPVDVIAGVAKSIITVGALNLIGGIATRYLSAKAGATLSSWSQNNKSVYRKSAATKILKASSNIKQSIKPIQKALRDTAIAKAGVARQTQLKSIAGKPGYGLARLTSAFKNPKTLLATVGGTWKKNVLSGMGVAYAVDNLMGFTGQIGLEKKDWYDVPGKISNFGKWLINDSIYGTAMGAAGPVIGAIGSIGTKAAGKAFGGSFGKQILDFASKFSPGIPAESRYDDFFDKQVLANVRSNQEKKFGSNAVKKGLFGLTSNVSETFRQAQNSFYSTSDAVKDIYKETNVSFGDRTKKALATISSAIKNVRDIKNRPRKQIARQSATAGLEAFGALSKLSEDALNHKPTGSQVSLLTDGMKDIFIPEIMKHNKSKTGLGQIFGFLDSVKVREVVNQQAVDKVSSQLKHKYVHSEVDQVMKLFLDMNVGSNIYKDWRGSGIKGGGVDLGAFDPIQVMRRTASFIANKQFNIPFSKSSLSIGDITGLTPHLAEKPSFLFFDKAPAFRIDGSDTFKSTLDLDPNGDARYLYLNGKWAVFNGLGINVVDSKRNLILAHKSSKNKRLELKQIQVDRIKNASSRIDPANSMEYYNKIKDRIDNQNVPTNRFLSFLDRYNLGIPAKLIDMSDTIIGKFTNKQKYKTAVNSFFTDPIELSHRNLPYIDNIYEHTSQVFSEILHRKGAHQELARYSLHHYLQKDFLEALNDDQLLVKRLTDAFGGETRGVSTGKDTVSAVKFLKAFPEQAISHDSIKRLGPLSSMTARDIARKNYIEDVFNKQFLNEDNSSIVHPLIGIADDLFEKGITTKKETNILKLHAKLSVFKDRTLQRNIQTSSDLQDVMTTMHRRFGASLNESHQEMINFISNYDMRSAKIKNSQERINPDSQWKSDNNPYSSVGNGPLGLFKDLTENSLDSVTDMISDWLPFKKKYLTHHGFEGNLKYIGGILGTTAAAFGAYRIIDTVVATNPGFDNTMFDEGITGMAADTLAKIRFGISRVADVTGVTSTMKYLHGLAPHSETSIPGAIIGGVAGLAMSKSPWGTIKMIAGGAILNRIASPYLPDMTKSHEELVEIYSGRKEVPVMKAPTWLLGGTPWGGSKVDAWSPNWYIRAKSRWKETDTLYGSSFRRLIHEPLPLLGFNVGDLIDPYYLERKHYFSRPYPVSGGVFDEVPIIGKVLSNTIGRIIKPEKTMHQEFLEQDQISSDVPGNQFAIRPPNLAEGKVLMRTPGRIRSMGGITMNQGVVRSQPNRYVTERAAEDFLYDIQNFSGLKGFLAGSISERIFGEAKVIPTLETAGRIASFSRSYTDLNLGGIGILCLPQGEKVLTPSGLTNIEDININDIVLSDKYEIQKITHKGSRLCNNNEKVYELTTGASNTKIKTTETHPIAIYKRIQCNNNKNRACIPGYSNKCINCSKQKNIISWEWIQAKDVTAGDFSVQPLPHEKQTSVIIDLAKYTNRGISNKYIYFGSNDFAKAYELLECNPTLSRKEIRKHVDDKYAKEALNSFRHNKVRRQNRYIIIDEDLAWFIGWWLAEGSSNNKTISFTLNINERHIAEKLGSIFINKQLGASYNITEIKEKNTCILRCTNLAFALYLKHFGNVYSKSLKELIYLPEKQAIKLCEGYINGDGWLNYKLKQGGATSVSGRLIRDVWLLLYRLGVQSTILVDYKEIPNSKSKYPQGSIKKETIRSYLKFSKNGFNNLINVFKTGTKNGDISTGLTFTNNNYLYIKITNVSSEDYSNKIVYDITVDKTNCFIGNYILLHNSEPIRRLIDKPEYKRYGVNPIPNMMPNWLPSQFLTGDPWEKILRGELRLPGEAYLKNHTNVSRSMPARSCFTPETLIDTSDGLIPIILAKDSITNDGSYQKVIKLHETEFEGELLEIELSGINKKYNINVTENHDIFSIKTNKCKYYPKDTKLRRCCFECKDYKKLKYCKEPAYNITENKAKDLEVGDYLLTPIIKISNTIKKIDLYKLLKGYKKYTFKNEGIYSNNIRRYSRYLNITSELMKLIGFYLAEGSLSSHQITFSFHTNEIEFHNFIKEITKELFNSTTNILIKNNSARVISNCTLLRDILEALCGKTKEKHLPKNIYKFGKQNIYNLLSGYFLGDGHYIKKYNKKSGTEIAVTTCIENLSFSIFKILCSLGYRPGICYNKGKNTLFIKEKRIISSTQKYVIRLYGKFAQFLANKLGFDENDIKINELFYKGYIPYKIKHISKKKYSGKVYDLTIENNHNYCVPFALVHNSMLGAPLEHMVQYFTGLLPPLLKEEYDILETGTAMHAAVQQNLAAEGLLIQAEALVNDVKNDITGHVDAIIRDGRGGKGRIGLEIKTINDQAFQKMTGPKNQHMSQLNFYLKELKCQKGQILYINRENPSEVKLFNLNFSQSRWERDLQKLKKARGVSATMMQEGVGDTLGYSYSWLDRLNILADVAPTSQEYKEAKYIVQKQIKSGVLTTDDGVRYKDILKKRQARIRKYELYPNRFKNKVFNPETENDIQSINDDIKAAAEYSLPERAIGSLWERFTNTNTFLVNKFFAAKDPLEHYKMTRLYGKEYKPWDEPIRSWAEPMYRGMMSKTSPVGGGISFGLAGNLLGGGLGTIIGGGLGTAYGSLHGLYRFATGTKYIPENIQEKRDIISFFDAAKYEKNNMLAQLSQGLTQQEFLEARNATLTAYNNNEGSTVANLFRATSFMEKPYIEAFLQENDPKKREEILSFIPKDLGKALQRQWNQLDSKDATKNYVQMSSNDLAAGGKRLQFNQSILDPGVNLEDIQLKVIENQGMDVHEFGLGWNEQMLRIQESQNIINAGNIESLQYNGEPVGPNLSSAHVRGLINNLFNKSSIHSNTQVYINNSGQKINTLNITIRRNRSRSIINVLNRREKYGM